jgi:hypothetical protein
MVIQPYHNATPWGFGSLNQFEFYNYIITSGWY